MIGSFPDNHLQPTENVLKRWEGEKKMEITKIVITGGPCAGKTTDMSWVQNNFTAMGYAVLFVPETATERITGGVAPGLVEAMPSTSSARCSCSWRRKRFLPRAQPR